MATVHKKESGIRTVGALIKSLQRFPADLPVATSLDDEITIYQLKPAKGECYADKRGEVCIDGEDPWND